MTGPSVSFGIASFNINRQLLAVDRQACVRVATAQAGLIGLQEVDTAAKQADVDTAAPAATWLHAPTDHEDPMLVKRAKWLLSVRGAARLGVPQPVGSVKLSDGIAHVTPDRWLTWLCVDFVAAPVFTPMVVADTHWVSGVGNPAYADTQAARLAARQQEFETAAAAVATWHSLGLPVLLFGDFNWGPMMPKLHPAQVWLVNDGIDKIAWIPAAEGNFDLLLVSAETHTSFSDHPLKVANVRAVANAHYPPPAPPPPPPPPPDRAPVVDLDVEPHGGPAPLRVEATWSATDPDGDQLTVTVDWGDGTGETLVPPSGSVPPPPFGHTYAAPGSYPVRLRAVDPSGLAGNVEVGPVEVAAPPVLPVTVPMVLAWVAEVVGDGPIPKDRVEALREALR